MSEQSAPKIGTPPTVALGAPAEILLSPSPPTSDEIATSPVERGLSVTAPGGAEDGDLRGFLWNAHTYVNEYIRFSDAKAGFVATLAGALLGALFSAKAHEMFLKVPVWTSFSWLSVTSFVLLLLSILLSVFSIRPRLWSAQPRGYIFWGGVTAHDSQETFYASLKQQSASALTEQVAHHFYNLSLVCRSKYLWVSLSILAGSVGGLLGAVVLLFRP